MSNNNSDQAGYGCMIMFLAIFVIPQLIDLINTLVPLAILAGIGFCVFKLLQYDQRTGNVTAYFERTFNLNGSRENDTIQLEQGADETYGLPEPDSEVLEQLEVFRKKLEDLETENRGLREKQKTEIYEAIRLYADEIDKKNKDAIFSKIFGDTVPDDFAKSDEFEIELFEESQKKKAQDAEIRALKLEVNEQLFEREREALLFKTEAQLERGAIRMEMSEGFANVEKMLAQVENKMISIKGYFDEKFARMEITVQKEFSNINNTISILRNDVVNGFANVDKEIAGVKLSFGKEVLRLDKAQMRIVTKLGEYENKVRQFVIQTKQIQVSAERQSIRSERMLNQAQNLYWKHQAEMKNMGKDLEVGLEKISLHNKEFSYNAGMAKLQLDEISNKQYIELKNISFAQIGTKMLREDFSKQEQLAFEKIKNLNAERRRTEERIREENSRGRETEQFRHRISMLDEKLNHAHHQKDIMQREFSVFKRLNA